MCRYLVTTYRKSCSEFRSSYLEGLTESHFDQEEYEKPLIAVEALAQWYFLAYCEQKDPQEIGPLGLRESSIHVNGCSATSDEGYEVSEENFDLHLFSADARSLENAARELAKNLITERDAADAIVLSQKKDQEAERERELDLLTFARLKTRLGL